VTRSDNCLIQEPGDAVFLLEGGARFGITTPEVLYALGYLPLPILPLLIIAWISLRVRHLRWRDVGLQRPVSWLKTIGFALLIGIGYQLLDILVIAPLLQFLTGVTTIYPSSPPSRTIRLLIASLVIS
jgi:hypothetical protein